MVRFVLLFLFVALLILRWKRRRIDHFPSELPVVTFTALGKHGRLGNQLFQLAAVLAYAEMLGAQPVLPSSAQSLPLFQLFDLPGNQFVVRDVQPTRTFHEKGPTALETNLPRLGQGDVLDLMGYFQHQAFLDTFKLPRLRPEMQELANNYGDFIGVHVRRGDYVGLGHLFQPLTPEWFRRALDTCIAQVGPSKVIVCSDDIPWCREHLRLCESDCQVTFSEQTSEIGDFAILAGCKAAVISNSSFAWWAAQYGNKRAVVMPWTWFTPGSELDVWNKKEALVRPGWTVVNAC